MSEIVINSSSGPYSISVENGGFGLNKEVDFAILDSSITKKFASLPESNVIVKATEPFKNLSTVEAIIESMSDSGVNRSSTVFAVGGGVIQDLATLSSAIYMRGVSWVFAPTTLTAMADSCIGGKSSINSKKVKNLIGNFHPPKRIVIDTSFLNTLPTGHIISGLSEAVKICFARGESTFIDFLEISTAKNPLNFDAQALVQISLQSKKWFVEIDEFDKAERQLLNFGHSFGHAIEAATDFALPHGIAVAFGMLAAINFSKTKDLPGPKLLETYCLALLRIDANYVKSIANMSDEKFIDALASDKKNSSSELRLVLPDKFGRLGLASFNLDRNTLASALGSVHEVVREVGFYEVR